MDRAKLYSASISLPFVVELRCMVGRIDPIDNENPSLKSSYHLPVLKCRSLINALPEIIASPTNDAEGNIHIVTTGDLFKAGKVRSVLRNINIQCLRFVEVTRQIFEACLKYTILFHVAPAWNRIDDYLLQGRDFLISNRPVEAIKLNVLLIDEEIRFLVSPASLQLPQLTLEYFSLSKQVIENFITNETGYIAFKDQKSRAWVHVLPSLKKGIVMSVSKRIPESSPFADYRQLRRHWKNMYGYRLPESEADLIYYQVYFPWAGQDCYTYPNLCLSPAKLVNFPLDRQNNTAEQFLKDLTKIMPKIFGISLKFKGLDFGMSADKDEEEAQKENVPSNLSSIGKRFDKIWKVEATPWKFKCKTSYDDELPVASFSKEDKIDNDEEWFSLLRSRSSFDFNEFSKTLDGRDPFDEMMSGNLIGEDNRGTTDIDNGESDGLADGTMEIKSRFFANLDGSCQESSAGDSLEVEKKSDKLKLPSTRVKLHRLSDRKLQSSITSSFNLTRKDRPAINFKTRDISSYFIQKKKKARTSHSPETDAGKNFDQPQSRVVGEEQE